MKLVQREKIIELTAVIALPVISALLVGVVIEKFTRSSSTPYTNTSSTNAGYGYESVYEQYRYAAVTSETNICSRIGWFEDITCYLSRT